MNVAFYKGRTRLFNRLVSWWLRGRYSHCELVLWTNPQGVSFCVSSSFMDGGVRTKWMTLDPDHWDLVPVSGSVAQACSWSQKHEEARYDLLGLLGFVWRRAADDREKFFCSESVAEMLGFSDAWRFDPMTLWAAVLACKSTSQMTTEGVAHA